MAICKRCGREYERRKYQTLKMCLPCINYRNTIGASKQAKRISRERHRGRAFRRTSDCHNYPIGSHRAYASYMRAHLTESMKSSMHWAVRKSSHELDESDYGKIV